MIFEEVLVWFEYWEFSDVSTNIELAHTENSSRKDIKNVVGRVEIGTIILEKYWLDRVQSLECAPSEIDKLGVVSGASLREHHQWSCVTFLTQFLSFAQLFHLYCKGCAVLS